MSTGLPHKTINYCWSSVKIKLLFGYMHTQKNNLEIPIICSLPSKNSLCEHETGHQCLAKPSWDFSTTTTARVPGLSVATSSLMAE